MNSPDKLTPLLKQYYAIKNQNPGRILFFRMGDFYELFGDDAVTASSVLGIALTSRGSGNSKKIPLAGVPHHTLNRYLTKMLRAGYRIAVCDQVEDPKKAKGIVKREVTEVLTPGSVTLDGALEEDRPNYLAGINPGDGVVGLALLDFSTGRFLLDEFVDQKLGEMLSFYAPSEITLPEGIRARYDELIKSAVPNASVTLLDDYRFETSLAYNDLLNHFGIPGLDGFGLGEIKPSLGAAGAVLAYARDLKMGRVGQVTRIERIRRDQIMELDSATIRNLELVETPYEGRKNSLISVIDRTISPGGGRLLRDWILSPLTDLAMILGRQDAVKALIRARNIDSEIRLSLKGMPDLERLGSRIAMLKAGPRDIVNLKTGLIKTREIGLMAARLQSPLIDSTMEGIEPFDDLIDLIDRSLVDEPPANIYDGGLFKTGYSGKLDTLVSEIEEARKFIHNLQQIERDRTGITSLKVGFNRVFGYYIEITRPHLARVPDYYIRKQTLVAAERFITEELKVKEELILNAEEKIKTLEAELFEEVVRGISARVAAIQKASIAVSVIDVLSGFASLAGETGYIMPIPDQGMEIEIIDGRHPVIESLMPSGKFVPNDVLIDGNQRRMAIITGPNMAGKSTYLRQVGLIALMTQIGAPVPARSARIGICDRIFTRVGASDDLLRGRSTFMVEMTEAAAILNNATDRSLILLDELGRGTSTYDGLAIAWSLVEYLNSVKGKKARTLFATHYHELIELAESSDGIINLQVAVKQWQDSIVFLYKIEPGGCDDSYGVQVARLAGLPGSLLDRAREILVRLEEGHTPSGEAKDQARTAAYQISLFSPDDNKIRDILKNTNPDHLTPIEALGVLNKLKNIIDGEE